MTDPVPLLHPGYAKTGTTFLQECVFADTATFTPLMTHGEVDRWLLRPNDLAFDAAAACDAVRSRLDAAVPGTVPVLSSETLSANILTGMREAASYAGRLSAVFARARVLLTVRAQQPMLASIYAQYVKRGRQLTPAAYFDRRYEPGYFAFDPVVLEYDRLAVRYEQLFGEGSVLVLPQELLRSRQDEFLAALCRFAGLDDRRPSLAEGSRGESPPVSGMGLMRLGNRFQSSALQPAPAVAWPWLGRSLHRVAYRVRVGEAEARRQLTTTISTRFAGLYRESNQRLQRLVPVSLNELGYEAG